MIRLSVTFEKVGNVSKEKFTKENEKILLTIENIANEKVSNVKIENFTKETSFDWDDEMEELSLQMTKFTFEYNITNEKFTKVKIFLDLLLEMDVEFTYETK